jgi:hypothetical protein
MKPNHEIPAAALVQRLELAQLLKDFSQIHSSHGYLLMRLAVAKDAQDAFDVCKQAFTDAEPALKRLEAVPAWLHTWPAEKVDEWAATALRGGGSSPTGETLRCPVHHGSAEYCASVGCPHGAAALSAPSSPQGGLHGDVLAGTEGVDAAGNRASEGRVSDTQGEGPSHSDAAAHGAVGPSTLTAPSSQSQQEARKAYIEKLHESTRAITDRIKSSEQLTASDYALQISATATSHDDLVRCEICGKMKRIPTGTGCAQCLTAAASSPATGTVQTGTSAVSGNPSSLAALSSSPAPQKNDR